MLINQRNVPNQRRQIYFNQEEGLETERQTEWGGGGGGGGEAKAKVTEKAVFLL